MFLEVGEVFVTTDDIINGNAFGHRQEIEVFRVADVGLGFYGNIGDEADIIDHFEEVIACLGRDEFVDGVLR